MILRGSSRVEWEGVLRPSNWTQTKSRFLLPNLSLQNEDLVLGRTATFMWTGEGGVQRFSIALRLTWRLENGRVVQTGTIDGLPIEGFESQFSHRVNELLGA